MNLEDKCWSCCSLHGFFCRRDSLPENAWLLLLTQRACLGSNAPRLQGPPPRIFESCRLVGGWSGCIRVLPITYLYSHEENPSGVTSWSSFKSAAFTSAKWGSRTLSNCLIGKVDLRSGMPTCLLGLWSFSCFRGRETVAV